MSLPPIAASAPSRPTLTSDSGMFAAGLVRTVTFRDPARRRPASNARTGAAVRPEPIARCSDWPMGLRPTIGYNLLEGHPVHREALPLHPAASPRTLVGSSIWPVVARLAPGRHGTGGRLLGAAAVGVGPAWRRRRWARWSTAVAEHDHGRIVSSAVLAMVMRVMRSPDGWRRATYAMRRPHLPFSTPIRDLEYTEPGTHEQLQRHGPSGAIIRPNPAATASPRRVARARPRPRRADEPALEGIRSPGPATRRRRRASRPARGRPRWSRARQCRRSGRPARAPVPDGRAHAAGHGASATAAEPRRCRGTARPVRGGPPVWRRTDRWSDGRPATRVFLAAGRLQAASISSIMSRASGVANRSTPAPSTRLFAFQNRSCRFGTLSWCSAK